MPDGSETETRFTGSALVLGASVPFVFFHVRYLPTVSIPVGSTSASVTTADVAIGVVAAAAAWRATRDGVGRLRAGIPLWITTGLLLVWIGVGIGRDVGHPNAAAHMVTGLKFTEYTALVLAVPLIVRRTNDLKPLLWVLVAWSVAASVVATLQIVGTPIFDPWKAGWRQPSFLGHHDLAALSAIVTMVGCAALVSRNALRAGRWLIPTALSAGVVGLVLSGSAAAAAGVVAATFCLALVGRRRFGLDLQRALGLAAVCVTVCVGVVVLRADPLASFLRFVGVREDRPSVGVETYSQRTVLAYIGGRIFLEHPIVGVGWERSGEESAFAPFIPDARKRFPGVVEEAFPAPGRELGIQNAYIQVAAELGVVGLGLLLSVFAAGLVLAARAARLATEAWAEIALIALSGTISAMAIWTAIGVVAGIPLDAVTWLVLGLAAAAAAAAAGSGEGSRG